MDLPWHFQSDVVARYVSELPQPEVPGYFTFDARLAWQRDHVELAIVGQNLADRRHPEFSPGAEIPRSVYGSVTVRW
jgi:iron complex outermembrane receptor protein